MHWDTSKLRFNEIAFVNVTDVFVHGQYRLLCTMLHTCVKVSTFVDVTDVLMHGNDLVSTVLHNCVKVNKATSSSQR